MKKIIALSLLILTVLVSCGKDDGWTVISESEITNKEITVSASEVGMTRSFSPSVYMKEDTIFEDIYNSRLHVTGKILSIESHSISRAEAQIAETGIDLFGNTKSPYTGYTETEIEITGIIDIFGKGSTDYQWLIGRKITARQAVFWYYDEDGKQQISVNVANKYSYYLPSGTEAVLILNFKGRDAGDYKNSTSAMLEEWLDGDILYLNDYYPVCDHNNEKIGTKEQLMTYFLWLDEQHGGSYIPFSKNDTVKLSFENYQH